MYIICTFFLYTLFDILLICLGNVKEWLYFLCNSIFKQPVDMAKISVPAIVYMIQNNLLFVGVSNLPAATFQVIKMFKRLNHFHFFIVNEKCFFKSFLVARKSTNKNTYLILLLFCD